jgi:hypothetical protein
MPLTTTFISQEFMAALEKMDKSKNYYVCRAGRSSRLSDHGSNGLRIPISQEAIAIGTDLFFKRTKRRPILFPTKDRHVTQEHPTTQTHDANFSPGPSH